MKGRSNFELTSYPEYAHLFTVLSGRPIDNHYKLWFIQNFIQLRFDTSSDVDKALFFEKDVEECTIYRCSLLYHLTLNRDLIARNIIESVILFIAKNYFIVLVLDHFYLSCNKTMYHLRHMNHECLLCNYDQQSKTFEIYDFFDNQYKKSEITEQELMDAYYNHNFYKIFDDDRIHLFHFQEDDILERLPFQILKLKASIRNFIEGELSKFDGRTYGVNCLDILLENVALDQYDFRDFHLLYDHARANVIRLQYIQELGIAEVPAHLYNMFTKLESTSQIMRNLLIKQKIQYTKKCNDDYKSSNSV